MDVSFTNVLEGARQYFQGLPVPSTGAATSVEHNLHATSSSTSSASSTSTTTHDHGAPSQPTQSTQSTSTSAGGSSGSNSSGSAGNSNGNSGSASNIQESSRYVAADVVRPTSSMESSNAVAGSSFWNPHVEPYPPQPTRVEVPDTRPGDEGATMEPSSSSSSNSITLTEMQPSNHQSSSSSAVVTSNLPQRPSSASLSSASSSNDHSRHHHPPHLPPNSSSHLHQMQPPQPPLSPAPVYQQLNNVSMASFSAVEMLASSSTATYQTASNNDRQAQPIVAQRTQYYPRYHHPDITKCAPAPYSQASIYQSANVAQPSNTAQQPSTRPTPIEQNAMSSGVQEHRSPEQQRLSVNYGSNVPPAQSPLGGSIVYGSSSSVSSQSYRSAGQHQQQTHRLAGAPASCISDRSHGTEGPHSSTSSSPPIVSSRQITAGSSSSHIPPQSQNLPAAAAAAAAAAASSS